MRSKVFLGVVLAVVVLASLFAPAPVTRTVQADQSNACRGLNNAFHVCLANNPNTATCSHIWEQVLAHGCYYGSGSGSGSSS
jgi:hypothetical protein